jgi:bifunctional dethiobiotin synthetase / adenosylmethionine---8-amino-7-oxononanoate aminotransferase
LPLCTTTASQEIFDAFLADDKASALLHGHSYTAHAVGCSVGVEALRSFAARQDAIAIGGSVYDESVVRRISEMDSVEGVVALGTVLAVTLKVDASDRGYQSSVAEGVKTRLLYGAGDGMLVHSRVLGNVIYFMTGLTTKQDVVRDLEERIVAALQDG